MLGNPKVVGSNPNVKLPPNQAIVSLKLSWCGSVVKEQECLRYRIDGWCGLVVKDQGLWPKDSNLRMDDSKESGFNQL